MASSSPQPPIDCDNHIDTDSLKGKTAIVTGGEIKYARSVSRSWCAVAGANGLGEAYVRALVVAGVHVCIADLNADIGEKLSSELSNCKYIRCNVTSWTDQVSTFREAASFSPSGRIDYVVANAGIHRPDEVFAYDGDGEEPKGPDLLKIDVNLRAVLYTTKLAFHYFIKQIGTQISPKQQDTSLVLIGSGAAFLDVPRGPQYSAAKWGVRGIMHSLRRMALFCGSRVNMIDPWYVRTKILSQEGFEHVRSCGVDFAEPEDAGQALLRLPSDRNINGRSLFIAPRKWAPRGYRDVEVDDFPAEDEFLQEIQADQIKSAPVELGMFV